MFHYCSLQGLQGIVESRRLWASNSQFLNDRAEVQRARDILGRSKDLILKELRIDPGQLQTLQSQLERVATEDFHVFVTSFCEKPDKLSQWRGYAQQGHGVSIGFSRQHLEALGYSVRHVIYDRLLRQVIEALGVTFEAQGAGDEEELRRAISRQLIEFVSVAKPDAFSEEEEIRIIVFSHQVGAEDTKFRVVGKLFVPFVEIDLSAVWPSVIQQVWLGPQLLDDTVHMSVRHFLTKHGLDHVQIFRSRAPLRA
jgi:Protein of unknown function (DUF2971)